MTTYTHTRIRREHLDKLQALADREKRSAMKQLEVLIDAAFTPAHQSPQGDSHAETH